MIYLIKELHEELNNIENNPVIIYINENNNYVTPFDQRQVFDDFIKKFAIKHYSLISDNFVGISQRQFECQRCKFEQPQNINNWSSIRYEYETFFYLEFPLDEVRNYIAEQNNILGNYQNISQINIYDCFNYYQKINTKIDYCESCKRNDCLFNIKKIIYSPSRYLVLIFKKEKQLGLNIKINFPLLLDISNIIINNDNQHYELQGIVKHIDDNSHNGYYISFCRSAVPMFNNQWYCYNDQNVMEVNFQNIIDKDDTYILFYELKNNQW